LIVEKNHTNSGVYVGVFENKAFMSKIKSKKKDMAGPSKK